MTKPFYDKALRSSGFSTNLHYYEKNTTKPMKRNRKWNIIWLNLPYSKNVQTNIAKSFLNIIKKHFPPNHNPHPVFNKNNMKVSYSCMPNIQTWAASSTTTTRKSLPTTTLHCKTDATVEKKKDQCPLDNNCLTTSVIYKANVTTDKDDMGKNYIGLTEGAFKPRYTQHKLSFWNRK